MITREAAKRMLGDIPLTAELYWLLRQGGKPPRTGYQLEELKRRLPALAFEAGQAARHTTNHKRVCIFCTLHYWISHGTILGLALAGMGHKVTLVYTPYGDSARPVNKFDLRRQDIYTRKVLGLAAPLLKAVSFLAPPTGEDELRGELREAVDEISLRDTQYTLQVEEVSEDQPLYQLRLQRNRAVACRALAFLSEFQPDVMVIPNGSILEFGAVYQVVRSLAIPVVTYEFGEQRDHLWLRQDGEVMRQETDDLWQVRGGKDLRPEELERIRSLIAARQKGSIWGNFWRRWQGAETQGGQMARSKLGLDSRQVALLATNVIGDSLTLGRQVFSDSMTEWLIRTLRFFAEHPEVQLIVRIHPGELVTKGPSVADIVHKVFPQELPGNIHLISADDRTNTYDLVEIADYGLVYTTTVGLEMALCGIPVVVVGRTHYRNKGFTNDPESWSDYFDLLAAINKEPGRFRLHESQVTRAWEYAYRFFFEYPRPYPWHLLYLWEDLGTWPLRRVLSMEGMEKYEKTFAYLTGEPIDWAAI